MYFQKPGEIQKTRKKFLKNQLQTYQNVLNKYRMYFSSHLLTIPSGDMLSGAIGSSPILVEEGGASMAATGGLLFDIFFYLITIKCNF